MNSKPFDLKNIRNRVIELCQIYPHELKDHPGQWREHNEYQANALAGVLREIGQAGALLVWKSEREGGALTTWDGHLRKSLDPNLKWPVLITDLDDAEADYMMAVYDPLTALAKADRAALDALLSSVRPGEAAVQQMLSDIVNREQLSPPAESPEYNEPVESETEYIECPSCGHKWPR